MFLFKTNPNNLTLENITKGQYNTSLTEKLYDPKRNLVFHFSFPNLNCKDAILNNLQFRRRSIAQQKVFDLRIEECEKFSSLNDEQKKEGLIHFCHSISNVTLYNCKGLVMTYDTVSSQPSSPESE